ncbi:hypothetical protein JA1_001803 [Spathaspora sp. JA1]|nr:hypothetical protein JA1_001803 [Spathaspora sp. JA1]
MTGTLAEQVKINLIHYNQWTDVVIHESTSFVSGKPPNSEDLEWVIPSKNCQLTVDEINQWFKEIEKIQSKVDKVTIGVVNDDGTIVYYYIHNGIVEPRQN